MRAAKTLLGNVRSFFGGEPIYVGPTIEPPADLDSWEPLRRELWHIIAAPRLDRAEFDRVVAAIEAELCRCGHAAKDHNGVINDCQARCLCDDCPDDTGNDCWCAGFKPRSDA